MTEVVVTPHETTAVGDESVSPQTQALIDAAHRCDSLADIEEHLPYPNIGQMWASLAGQGGDRPWLGYYLCEATTRRRSGTPMPSSQV